jgi:hypothetical protein
MTLFAGNKYEQIKGAEKIVEMLKLYFENHYDKTFTNYHNINLAIDICLKEFKKGVENGS